MTAAKVAPILPPLPTIREVLKLYKVGAMKHLSQNFLLNEKLTEKIIQKTGRISENHVLEVGPGPGGLTRSIIKRLPEKLIVVEKDKRFKPILDMLADAYATVNGEMDIIYDDIMKINMNNLFPSAKIKSWEDKIPQICIIGNLPFNVSTPLIIKWLHAISERRGPWAFGRTKMTLTFQKEVAERIIAQPLEEQRCRLSIMAQTWTHPVLHFTIPGAAFLPKPEVDVSVVSFLPLVVPRTKHEFKIFEKVTRHIFSFRQKYCIRGIQTLFPLDCRQELGEMMFNLSDVDPQTRPMQLTIQDIDKLVTAYKYIMKKHPEVALYEYRASRRIVSIYKAEDVEVTDYYEP